MRDVVNAYHQKVGEKEQRERAARGEIGGRKGDRGFEEEGEEHQLVT